MDPKTLKKLNEARANRQAAIVVINLEDGRDRLILEGERVEGVLGEAIRSCFLSGKSTSIELQEEEFFLNVYVPPPRIVVIGAVHITQALVDIARTTGFDLSVIDPRTAFATPERFSAVPLFPDWPEDVFSDHPLDAYCALAAVTHDPKIDDFPLLQAIDAQCFYVGALGSRKTHAKRLDRLRDQGASEEELKRIHSPIGLDIGAATPSEIAVAIMAEIISAFRNRGPAGSS